MEDMSRKAAAEMDKILNKQSGVLGVSGVHSDDRAVKAAAVEGNQRAKLARDIQWYQIRKCIGSYIAAMNGVDVICFTAGVGENGPIIRNMVCEYLGYMGVELDAELNGKRGQDLVISKNENGPKVMVIGTNEELMIARDTYKLVK